MSQTYTVTDSDGTVRTTTEWYAAVEECSWWAEKMADRAQDGWIEVTKRMDTPPGYMQPMYRVEVTNGVIVYKHVPGSPHVFLETC